MPLGTGGMGEVYKARDLRLGREVAIKFVKDQFSERFEREARSVGALNHPHICRLYDIGPNYLVMELIEGTPLTGPLPLNKALTYGAQICAALEASHKKGIIHRDLKPANILVTKSGVKLLDFGLAKTEPTELQGANDVTRSATQSYTIAGTLSYMAPEQLRGQKADARSDIFAFGCVLYEMVSGKQAFGGSDTASVIAAILEKEPPDIDSLSLDASKGFDRVLRKCLAKDPDSRWQSAHDLGDELGWIASDSAARSATRGQYRFRRFGPSTLIFLAVVAVGIMAAGGWVWVSRSRAAVQPSFQQLTFREGFISNALFKPDGGFAYTAAWTRDAQRIYSGRVGDRDDRELPAPAGASLAAISPTGELAIRTPPENDPRSGQMLAIAPSGGGSHRDLSEDVRAADWAEDGSAIAIVRTRPSPRIEYPIGHLLYESDDFDPKVLRISRDGKLVAVAGLRFGSSSFNGEVGVIDGSGRFTSLYKSSVGSQYESGPLCWSPDGREIWFSSREARDSGIVYATSLQGKVRQLLRLPGRTVLEDVRQDGAVLASVETRRYDINVHQGAATFTLPWFGSSLFPRLTPDGRTLVFEEAATGQFPLATYMRSLDNRPAIKISDGFPIAVAPSGRYVIARRHKEPAYVIVPTGAGEEKPIRMKGYELGAGAPMAWLPDEKNLVARAREPGHDWRLVLYNIESGALRAITPELKLASEINMPVAPDGSSVIGKVEEKWFSFPINGGAPLPLRGIYSDEHILQYALDGKHVFSARLTPTGGLAFFNVDLAGSRTPLTESSGEGPGALFNADISADGSTIVYGVRTLRSTLYLVSGVH